jgi:phosphonate transport system permease protein
MYAGWPSILREAIGYTLYIMDRNVRMASVLGLVGAGGIGLALHDTLRLFKYDESAALILVILSVILVFDYFSTWLRGKLT